PARQHRWGTDAALHRVRPSGGHPYRRALHQGRPARYCRHAADRARRLSRLFRVDRGDEILHPPPQGSRRRSSGQHQGRGRVTPLHAPASPAIEFWFEFGSNYSYLAVMRIEEAAARHGVRIVWKPFLLGPILRALGMETSPFVLNKHKGAYVWRDLAR